MINLYEPYEKVYDHNQYVLDECTKCEVTESLNGSLELDLEYPVQDKKQISSNIVRGAVVKCPVGDKRQPQLFRIRKVTKTTTKVRAYAEAIAIADLRGNFVRDTNIVGKTRRDAMIQILANTSQNHAFTVGTLDTNSTIDILRIVKYSPLRAMVGDDENTIINRYGGEIIYNNFELNMVDHRGSDKGVVISYGKNITGIEETVDDTELATSIIPVGKDNLLLPEYQIDSPYINNYEKIYYKTVDFNNIGIAEPKEDDPGVTREQALQKLRDAVALMYDVNKVDMLNFNYKVNFIQLSKTEEYKNYAILEDVELGDTVAIKHLKMNIDLEGRIIKTKYNVLLDRFSEIELGFNKKNLTSIINETNKTIEFLKQSIELGISNLDATLNSKLTLTESKIEADVDDKINELDSNWTITANGLEGKITDTKEELSNTITATASGLSASILDAKKDLHNDINITAAGFDAKLADAKSGLTASINATNSGLTTKLADTKQELLNDMAISASGLSATISSNKTELTNKIDITASNMNIKLADQKTQLTNSINTTASGLTASINDAKADLHNDIDVTAAGFTAKLNDAKTQLSNTINANQSGLTAKIADTKQELLNDISVSANGLDIKLSNQKAELTNTINVSNSNLNIKIADAKTGLQNSISATASSLRTEMTNGDNSLKALISAQPGIIMTQVSGEVQRQVNTKTATIQNEINDLTQDMDTNSSKIQQLSSSISSVVKTGDMASLIKQNSTAVKVAFNNINDYFQVTSSGATFGDVDYGEYTKLTSTGLEHYSHGSSRPYKYLTYVGYTTIHCSGSGYTSKRITLPSYFEGTNPQVICSIKKIYDSNSGRWCAAWWSGAYAYMDSDTQLRIEAMSVFRNWSNGDVWTDGIIDVAYMVIA